MMQYGESPWYFDPFVLPFTIGTVWLFGVIIYKWVRWFIGLPADDKALVRRNMLTTKSLKALKEVLLESLIHRRIWKTNPMLGFMHMSLALGWFLLIVVGKLETSTYIHDPVNPPHVHVFFRYFFPEEPASYVRHFNYALLMDCLLIFVLCGVALAWIKRFRSRTVGMRRTTRHTPFDRIALTSLWLIFPLRYLAESVTCGVHESGSFFTGGTGAALAATVPEGFLAAMEYPAWWAYSIALGLFFVAMPYSRYMHIFTEVPLIFLRTYKVKSKPEGGSFDQFQIQACSRCGICLDPCPIASELNINDIQAAYFLRDRRYGRLTQRVADTCLMCGRCAEACPVGIDQGTLRLGSRVAFARGTALYQASRYEFLETEDRSEGTGRVGFFAGCMTQLTPNVLRAMERIFAAAGVDVWWADRNGGVCCGRPMRLSGNLPAAERMERYNTELFRKHGITTLVTGCPICYKSFTQEYKGLKEMGIRVLHHTQYIAELIAGGRLKTSVVQASYAYHDPCELRGIHAEPRYVLAHVATLTNADGNGERDGVHCCGGSLANLTLDTAAQTKIGTTVVRNLLATGAETIVTSCPQCKKSLQRSAGGAQTQVMDIAEVVAEAI